MSRVKGWCGPLQIVGFLAVLLFAYTWTTPLRDIYGISVRNALMAREMLENGIAFIPRAMGHLYPDYPPLYFWLEVLFSLPAGRVSTLSVALPSALSAVGLVALTFRFGCEINRRIGWLAALILATSPSFWLEAGSATIDMLLAFHVMAAITCLYFRDRTGDARKRTLYICGALTFFVLAFLTKGLIGIVLLAAAWGGYLLMQRRLKDLVLFGLLAVFVGAVCVAGHLAMAWKAGGVDFVHDVIEMQFAGRVGQKANAPVYYYIICLLGAAGPWCFWCIPALARFFGRPLTGSRLFQLRKSMPIHPVNRLALIWFLGVLIIFTVASTKHSHYLLPLFPALAIMLAISVNRVVD